MKIQYFTILPLFLFGNSTLLAQTPQKFASKEECYRYNISKTGKSDLVAAEAFCKGKYPQSPIDTCAENKLKDFKMKNSISSVDEPKYLLKFKNECVKIAQADAQAQQQAVQNYQQQAQQAQQRAQLVEQQRAIDAANKAKEDRAALEQNLKLAQGLIPIVENAEKAYDSAREKASAQTSGRSTSSTAGTTSGINSQASTTNSSSAQTSTNTAATASTINNGDVFMQDTTYGSGAKTNVSAEQLQNKLENMSPEQIKAEHTKISEQLEKDSAALKRDLGIAKKDMPGIKEATDSVEKAPKSAEDVEPPSSEITAAAQRVNAELSSSIEQISANHKIQHASYQQLSLPFFNTMAAIESARNITTTYAQEKSWCTGLAEKTELVCLERTSPGWIAAKTVVNVSSPIIALVNSTQKACSNTTKITSLAGSTLTVAKGVCMASQATCLATCALKLSSFKTQVTSFLTKAEATLTAEKGEALGACTGLHAAKCASEVALKYKASKEALLAIKAVTAKESAPTPGTTAGLSKQCNMRVTDVLIMGANIASLAIAKKNADECDRKLAAAGAAGAAVTPTQFCETPSNANTEFCKCQRNQNQVGCPGYIASQAAADANKNMAGMNLKSAGGVSAFAGGENNSKSSFASNGSLAEKNTVASTIGSEKKSDDKKDSSENNGVGGYGAASSEGSASAGGLSGSGSTASDAAEVASDKKKWSFSYFANSVGGMFGGRGSRGGTNKNGNVNSQQDDAIQRKIASDNLAKEVTPASGKSNWEKVHRVYSIKADTLISGQ